MCLFVECVSLKEIYMYLLSLHFFHDTILAHLSSNVKYLIITYINHRRQSLTSTGFKSDETFYKIICKIVIVYRNFINRITRIIVWTGLDGFGRVEPFFVPVDVKYSAGLGFLNCQNIL